MKIWTETPEVTQKALTPLLKKLAMVYVDAEDIELNMLVSVQHHARQG